MNKVITIFVLSLLIIAISTKRHHSHHKIDPEQKNLDVQKWIKGMKQQQSENSSPVGNELDQEIKDQLNDKNKKKANQKLYKYVKHLFKQMKQHRMAQKKQRQLNKKMNKMRLGSMMMAPSFNVFGGLYGDDESFDEPNPMNFGSMMMRFPRQDPNGEFFSSSSSFGETISNDGNGPKRVIIGNSEVNNNGKKSKKVYHKADDMKGHNLSLSDEQAELKKHQRFFDNVNNNKLAANLFNREMSFFNPLNSYKFRNNAEIQNYDDYEPFGLFQPKNFMKSFKHMKKNPNAKYYSYSKILDSSISNDGKKARRVTLGKEETDNNGVKSKKIIHDADDLKGNKLDLKEEQEELRKNKRFFSNLNDEENDEKDDDDEEKNDDNQDVNQENGEQEDVNDEDDNVDEKTEKSDENQDGSEIQKTEEKKELPIMSPQIEKITARKMRFFKKHHKHY